jgi:lipopolysaccharide transport system permease protein
MWDFRQRVTARKTKKVDIFDVLSRCFLDRFIGRKTAIFDINSTFGIAKTLASKYPLLDLYKAHNLAREVTLVEPDRPKSPAKMTEKHEYVIDASHRKLFDWRELYIYKELFYFFTWRDVKIKYKQTVLGFLWAVLQPLSMMFIYTLVFSDKLSDPEQSLPYPVYVFSGQLIWMIFSSGLTNSSNSMVNNAMIIKKIYFPRLIVPVSSVLGALFDFIMGLFVFVGLLLFYGQTVSLSAFVYWPAAIMVTVLATLGPGCLLAALNVKYRDFRYIIPFLVQFLFFLTPIIYPISMLDKPLLKYLVVLSPMYSAVELFRAPLTGIAPDMMYITLSMASGIILLVAGLVYFKRTEDFFADFA